MGVGASKVPRHKLGGGGGGAGGNSVIIYSHDCGAREQLPFEYLAILGN